MFSVRSSYKTARRAIAFDVQWIEGFQSFKTVIREKKEYVESKNTFLKADAT
jgi:hypothetical protein